MIDRYEDKHCHIDRDEACRNSHLLNEQDHLNIPLGKFKAI